MISHLCSTLGCKGQAVTHTGHCLFCGSGHARPDLTPAGELRDPKKLAAHLRRLERQADKALLTVDRAHTAQAASNRRRRPAVTVKLP